MELPIIRFELEGVRHTVMRVLSDRQNDVEALVNAGIDAAIVELPTLIANRVREGVVWAVDKALEQSVKEYFSSGPGFDMVDALIQERLNPVSKATDKPA